MSYRVTLQSVPRQHGPALRRAATRALALAGAPAGELTVRLTDSDEIRTLNRVYAQDDHATDVLSFPSGEPASENSGVYFGDIAIALPLAATQAAAAGHEVQLELVLLTVHGVLHLLGHDHAGAAAQAAMWSLQDRVLADLGVPLRSPSRPT